MPTAEAASTSSRPTPPASLPTTLGALMASGWKSKTVSQELRANATAKIASGDPIVTGVMGYDQSVIPQLETAILAGHDVILLGERGQAKTRLIRSMVDLLDEWIPVISGSEINDDPANPVSRYALNLIAEHGDDTPIAWLHREDRYGEKLATPDTSIADLIGEVDPIKVAEGRYLSDELTVHYGMVPRVNRGIFAINELPDLAERIQVGLLNVLEERDIQIRGHRIRLPLDIVLVASANPEDYTNRGRIITPLKDRFGAQIRTHYPREVGLEVDIIRQEANLDRTNYDIRIPAFMEEIVAEFSQLARRSTAINQRSGVSVRLTVANFESVVANAIRRSLRTGDKVVVPRISDLAAMVPSTQGKIEIEALEDGREDELVAQLAAMATLQVFRRRVVLEESAELVDSITEDVVIHAGDDLAAEAYLAVLADLPAFEPPTRSIAGEEATPEEMAAALEFLLEGLHLTKRLNKDAAGARALYRQRRR